MPSLERKTAEGFFYLAEDIALNISQVSALLSLTSQGTK